MTIKELRAKLGQNLSGFPNGFDGSVEAYSKLTNAQQIKLTEEVSNYIAKHPEEFTGEQVERAKRFQKGESFGDPVETLTLGDAATVFKKEFGAQAERIAEKATGGFGYVAGFVVGVVAVALILNAVAPKAVKVVKEAAK